MIEVTIHDVIVMERSETIPDDCPKCNEPVGKVAIVQLNCETQIATAVGDELDEFEVPDSHYDGTYVLGYQCRKCSHDLVPAAEEIGVIERVDSAPGQLIRGQDLLNRTLARVLSTE